MHCCSSKMITAGSLNGPLLNSENCTDFFVFRSGGPMPKHKTNQLATGKMSNASNFVVDPSIPISQSKRDASRWRSYG